jgi:mRNA interferase MazF
MGKFAIGDIVLIDFPYSDFTNSKKRPALVMGKAEFDNLILCQITSKPYSSKRAIVIGGGDITGDSLPVTSYIRPDKVFTVDGGIIIKKLGQISNNKLKATKAAIANIFEL